MKSTKGQKMILGYARVSTAKQDTENQKGEIERWAAAHGLSIDDYVAETISSGKSDREIFSLVKGLRGGDTLIVSEISRLARHLRELLDIVNILIEKKVRIVFVKESLDIRDDNPAAMFTMSILGSVAQLEKSMIGLRTKEALVSRRNEVAKKLKKELGREPSEDEIKKAFGAGRRLGSKNKKRKLDGKENQIIGYINKKLNKTAIASLLGVSRDVLYDKLSEMKDLGIISEQ